MELIERFHIGGAFQDSNRTFVPYNQKKRKALYLRTISPILLDIPTIYVGACLSNSIADSEMCVRLN